MRKVDKLGRIVIPQALRKKYGLTEGAAIEFIDIGEGITLKLAEPLCYICHNKITDDINFPLCKSCMKKIAKDLTKK